MGAVAPAGPVSYLRGALTGDPLGNDEWGNCVEAGMLRQLQLWREWSAGSVFAPAASDAIALYQTLSGATAAPGPGTNLRDAEEYWATRGLSDAASGQIAMPYAIAPARLDAIDEAIRILGGVGMCWDLPESAVGASKWDGPAGLPIAGGHYTTCVGFDPDSAGARYTVLAWGTVATVSERFAREYLASVVGWLGREWFSADGLSAAGLDFDATLAVLTA